MNILIPVEKNRTQYCGSAFPQVLEVGLTTRTLMNHRSLVDHVYQCQTCESKTPSNAISVAYLGDQSHAQHREEGHTQV